MNRGKYLLLLLLQLAEHVLLNGRQILKVSKLPDFIQIYVGDLFFLVCESESEGEGEVMWFHNNTIVSGSRDRHLKVAVAAHMHSGYYHCERNKVKSEVLSINVLGYLPRASLILETGQPVVHTDGSVVLRLENDKGLNGWNCFVLREHQKRRILLKIANNSESITFQTTRLVVPETIYWCTNNDQSQRSNQVILRTSDKNISMEIYFAPVMAGDRLTLRCLHWGMGEISPVSFYKDNAILVKSRGPTYTIDSVTQSDQGDYKCHAIFPDNTSQTSDVQPLVVQEEVGRAVVTEHGELSCSCPVCHDIARYMWYKITNDTQPLRLPGYALGSMKPEENGIYACTVLWHSGRTLISRGYHYRANRANRAARFTLIITICLISLLMLIIGFTYYLWKQHRKRSNTGPVYEDVMLKSKEDNKYESLQGRGAQKESEYDTIQPAETHNVNSEGDYQPLNKGGMAEGVYHTVGMKGEGSGAAAGWYEALQKSQ